MKKYAFLFLMILTPVILSGCALFAVSAAGAGGYSVSEDTIEGIQNAGFDKTWLALKSTITKEGAVTLEDRSRGVIQASVNGREVEGFVKRITATTSKLSIKARKANGVFPDLDLAESLYDKSVRRI